MEEFDVPGDWWLPGEPDAVAPGRLRYSQQDGATLDLLEELSGRAPERGCTRSYTAAPAEPTPPSSTASAPAGR